MASPAKLESVPRSPNGIKNEESTSKKPPIRPQLYQGSSNTAPDLTSRNVTALSTSKTTSTLDLTFDDKITLGFIALLVIAGLVSLFVGLNVALVFVLIVALIVCAVGLP